MEKWQREVIMKSLPELLGDTECNDAFLARLLAWEVISKADVQTIKNNAEGYARNYKFWDLIPGRIAYDAVIKALKATNQDGVVALLEKGNPVASSPVSPLPSPPVLSQPVQPFPPTLPGANSPGASVGTPEIPMNVPQQDANLGGYRYGPPPAKPGDQIDFTENITPLRITVTRPQHAPTYFQDDHYQLAHDFKGFALILNITEFENPSRNRGGAKLDTQYMTDLWTQLGYHVTSHEGSFTLVQVDKILEQFKTQFTNFPPMAKFSCLIFIGSHGCFSKIESSDHREINLYKDVIYKFDSQNCPQLQGKPKIFLIQACQRFGTDSVPDPRTESDAMLQTPIDDTIVCFSTIPGYVANRDLYLGTWYTYCLAKVIMEEAHHMDLLRMLKKTQETMRKISATAPQGQLSTYLDLGIKTLYFNMRPR